MPAFPQAADILPTGPIHSVTLNSISHLDEPTARITMDNQDIYLVPSRQNGVIYRLPLAGGSEEKIGYTSYAGGRLDYLPPVVTGRWIVFVDTPDQGVPGTWKIRAENLDNFSERLIAESANDPQKLITAYSYAGEAGKLYWSAGKVATDGQVMEASLSMMDLDSGETALLSRTTSTGWIWSSLQVSNGKLVAEKIQITQGQGSNIFLFDPPDGQPRALSQDGISNMPQFSYPWVIWKDGSPVQGIITLQIYNLETLESRSINLPGVYDSDPLLNGSLVYWSGLMDGTTSNYAIYMLDLVKNKMYIHPADGPDILFPQIMIYGETIAWIRENVTGTGVGYLEWATLKLP